jgi:omega-hydroxy-beta-dihydromenaquinone-9 sulfotransferase
MYIDIGLFARAEYLALFKARFDLRRWGYILFFTALYWLMWIVVAFGRALDHALFPGFKRQLVRQPVFIVAPPRTGSTLTQKLMSLDKERFVYNALYQTIFPAVTFQRCFRRTRLARSKSRPALRASRAMGGEEMVWWLG